MKPLLTLCFVFLVSHLALLAQSAAWARCTGWALANELRSVFSPPRQPARHGRASDG